MLWLYIGLYGPHRLESLQAIAFRLQANAKHMEHIPVHDMGGTCRLSSVGCLGVVILEGRYQGKVRKNPTSASIYKEMVK
jgi:hypothetical protein